MGFDQLEMMDRTYDRRNDSIVIFVQLATSGQPGGQAGNNKADGDEGEDDGNDSKVDTTAMKLILSCEYDRHLANCVGESRILWGG